MISPNLAYSRIKVDFHSDERFSVYKGPPRMHIRIRRYRCGPIRLQGGPMCMDGIKLGRTV